MTTSMERKSSVVDKTVPFVVVESINYRFDRIIKRMYIIILVLILLLLGTNLGWLYYESQFEETTTTTVTQDLKSGKGDATINDGVHINGEREADSKDSQD